MTTMRCFVILPEKVPNYQICIIFKKYTYNLGSLPVSIAIELLFAHSVEDGAK